MKSTWLKEFLQEGTFPERKALIRNFVEGIEVIGDEVALTYTIPMPSDGVTTESASVLDFVQSGPPSYYGTLDWRDDAVLAGARKESIGAAGDCSRYPLVLIQGVDQGQTGL